MMKRFLTAVLVLSWPLASLGGTIYRVDDDSTAVPPAATGASEYLGTATVI